MKKCSKVLLKCHKMPSTANISSNRKWKLPLIIWTQKVAPSLPSHSIGQTVIEPAQFQKERIQIHFFNGRRVNLQLYLIQNIGLTFQALKCVHSLKQQQQKQLFKYSIFAFKSNFFFHLAFLCEIEQVVLLSLYRELRQRILTCCGNNHTAASPGKLSFSNASDASYNFVQLVIGPSPIIQWPMAQEEHNFNGQTNALRVPKFYDIQLWNVSSSLRPH